MFDKFYNSLDGLYSIFELDFTLTGLTPAIILNVEKLEEIYEPVYLNSTYGDSIKHVESIFKHSNGYYIYLKRKGVTDDFNVKIIYKVEQYEEVKIYINRLKKQK